MQSQSISKKQLRPSLIDQQSVFADVMSLYQYAEDILNVIESIDSVSDRAFYTSVVSDLIQKLDQSSRSISTSYFNINSKSNSSKDLEKSKIAQSIAEIAESMENVMQIVSEME